MEMTRRGPEFFCFWSPLARIAVWLSVCLLTSIAMYLLGI
jgi:hypothetical protein